MYIRQQLHFWRILLLIPQLGSRSRSTSRNEGRLLLWLPVVNNTIVLRFRMRYSRTTGTERGILCGGTGEALLHRRYIVLRIPPSSQNTRKGRRWFRLPRDAARQNSAIYTNGVRCGPNKRNIPTTPMSGPRIRSHARAFLCPSIMYAHVVLQCCQKSLGNAPFFYGVFALASPTGAWCYCVFPPGALHAHCSELLTFIQPWGRTGMAPLLRRHCVVSSRVA